MTAFVKKAKDHIPYAADQGLIHLAGALTGGMSIWGTVEVAADTTIVVTLPEEMANTDYAVIAQSNATDRPVTVTSKTATGFTVGAVVAADSVSIIVVGQVKDQTA